MERGNKKNEKDLQLTGTGNLKSLKFSLPTNVDLTRKMKFPPVPTYLNKRYLPLLKSKMKAIDLPVRRIAAVMSIEQCNALSLGSDKQFLVGTTKGEIQICVLSSLDKIKTISASNSPIVFCELIRNSTIITCSADGEIWVWHELNKYQRSYFGELSFLLVKDERCALGITAVGTVMVLSLITNTILHTINLDGIAKEVQWLELPKIELDYQKNNLVFSNESYKLIHRGEQIIKRKSIKYILQTPNYVTNNSINQKCLSLSKEVTQFSDHTHQSQLLVIKETTSNGGNLATNKSQLRYPKHYNKNTTRFESEPIFAESSESVANSALIVSTIDGNLVVYSSNYRLLLKFHIRKIKELAVQEQTENLMIESLDSESESSDTSIDENASLKDHVSSYEVVNWPKMVSDAVHVDSIHTTRDSNIVLRLENSKIACIKLSWETNEFQGISSLETNGDKKLVASKICIIHASYIKDPVLTISSGGCYAYISGLIEHRKSTLATYSIKNGELVNSIIFSSAKPIMLRHHSIINIVLVTDECGQIYKFVT